MIFKLLLLFMTGATAFEFSNNNSLLFTAVNLWCSNETEQAYNLYGSIDTWDVSEITNMSGLFLKEYDNARMGCNPYIKNWNTAKVTDMNSMFSGASSFDQPIGKWNTAKVTNMNRMFSGAYRFDQPIGKWNTAKVTNMNRMFYTALSFNQALCWDTNNVTNLSDVFYESLGSFLKYPDCLTKMPTNNPTTKKPTRKPTKKNKIITQIVGGEKVNSTDNSFKFIVSFQNKAKQHFCAGSLIHPNWVLTAAHCTDSPDFDTNAWLVFNTYDNRQRKLIKAIDMSIMHTSYWGRAELGNDIALIRLKEPVSEVNPVVINNCQKAEPFEMENQNLLVAGWGSTESGSGGMEVELRKVTVPIYRQDLCKFSYPVINDDQICAGYPEGQKDSCQGDSGGPLVYQNSNETSTLVGVVSWGYRCAMMYRPGVYTRVSRYIQWISDTIGADKSGLKLQYNSGCPPTVPPTKTKKPTRRPTAPTNKPTRKPITRTPTRKPTTRKPTTP